MNMEPLDLFDTAGRPPRQSLGPNATVLCGFALPCVGELLPALAAVETASPFRHMVTPGGFTMSVALTNCGELGWTTDRRGYRYTAIDPKTGERWPAMPGVLCRAARPAWRGCGTRPGTSGGNE